VFVFRPGVALTSGTGGLTVPASRHWSKNSLAGGAGEQASTAPGRSPGPAIPFVTGLDNVTSCNSVRASPPIGRPQPRSPTRPLTNTGGPFRQIRHPFAADPHPREGQKSAANHPAGFSFQRQGGSLASRATGDGHHQEIRGMNSCPACMGVPCEWSSRAQLQKPGNLGRLHYKNVQDRFERCWNNVDRGGPAEVLSAEITGIHSTGYSSSLQTAWFRWSPRVRCGLAPGHPAGPRRLSGGEGKRVKLGFRVAEALHTGRTGLHPRRARPPVPCISGTTKQRNSAPSCWTSSRTAPCRQRQHGDRHPNNNLDRDPRPSDFGIIDMGHRGRRRGRTNRRRGHTTSGQIAGWVGPRNLHGPSFLAETPPSAPARANLTGAPSAIATSGRKVISALSAGIGLAIIFSDHGCEPARSGALPALPPLGYCSSTAAGPSGSPRHPIQAAAY